MKNACFYINKKYLEKNVMEIIKLDPLLPFGLLLNFEGKKKFKQVQNIINSELEKENPRFINIRFKQDKLEGEDINDYKIRKLKEFVSRNPQHIELWIDP